MTVQAPVVVVYGFTLSPHEYNALWRRLDAGPKPLVLDTPDHGETLDDQAMLDRQAWEQLAQRGLVSGTKPTPDVEDVLLTLARPQVEADLRLRSGPNRTLRALACSAGSLAVVAVLTEDGGLRIEPARPTGLGEALVSQIPDHPAARGHSISLPAEVFAGQPVLPEQARNLLVEHGVRPQDATVFAEMLRGRKSRDAKIGAAARDRMGRRHRAPMVITVMDTEGGRCTLRQQPAPDGRGWITVTPVDRPRLIYQVNELITSVVKEHQPAW